MAAVTLRIGGRSYEIACRAGEEAHFTRIAALVDARAEQATRAVGTLSETRLLLFAALLLADDLGAPRDDAPPPALDPVFADAAERLAEQAERVAAALEAAGASD